MVGGTGTNCGTTKIAVSAKAAKIVSFAMDRHRAARLTGASTGVTAVMPHLISGPVLAFQRIRALTASKLALGAMSFLRPLQV
jgi:hypothetical protein